jgi:hypothetical protein
MRTTLLILLLAAAAAAQKVPPKPYPDFIHGDECLFCHRNDVGETWQQNAHTITMRQKEDSPEFVKMVTAQPALAAFLPEIAYYMGGRDHVRFLKKEGYGNLTILSTQAVVNKKHEATEWLNLQNPTWDKNKFQDRCSGCHMTAVDSATKQFAAIGHDCFTCHGDAPMSHTKDMSTVMLSKSRLQKGTDSNKVIVSMCAQCHLRGGKSKTTGLPYAYNFTPGSGEDLFQDYQIDFAKADDKTLNAGDRHVYWVVREVMQRGDTKVSCLSCHQIHAQSTARHWTAFRSRGSNPPVCLYCHSTEGKYTPGYTVHSAVCEY